MDSIEIYFVNRSIETLPVFEAEEFFVFRPFSLFIFFLRCVDEVMVKDWKQFYFDVQLETNRLVTNISTVLEKLLLFLSTFKAKVMIKVDLVLATNKSLHFQNIFSSRPTQPHLYEFFI